MLDIVADHFEAPPFKSTAIADLSEGPRADIFIQLYPYGSKLSARGTAEKRPAGQDRDLIVPRAQSSSNPRTYSMAAGGSRSPGPNGTLEQRMQALEDQTTRTDRTLNLVAQAVASVASAVSQLPAQLANAAMHPHEPTPGTLPAGVKRRQLPLPTIRQNCGCGCELIAEVNDVCSKCQSQVAERCRPGGMCPLCQYGEARDDGSKLSGR